MIGSASRRSSSHAQPPGATSTDSTAQPLGSRTAATARTQRTRTNASSTTRPANTAPPRMSHSTFEPGSVSSSAVSPIDWDGVTPAACSSDQTTSSTAAAAAGPATTARVAAAIVRAHVGRATRRVREIGRSTTAIGKRYGRHGGSATGS